MKPEVIGSKYRPDIDGLRAIAVLPVVLYHLGLGFPGGFVGVDIFFVISGYLITGIIKREIDQETFTIAGFYERRVRRLFPALFAMLTSVLVAGWFLLLPSDFPIALRGAIATVVFSSNVYFWRSGGYFAADSTLNPLLHTWSLAVEEQFYLVFPIFLLACCRFLPRHVRWITGLVALFSFGIAVAMMRWSTAVFYLSPFRAWELAVGCLLALDVVKPPTADWHREMIGASGLALIAYAVIAYSPKTSFPGWTALPPVLGAAMLLYCGASGGSAASRLLKVPLLVYVGAISYSLYLWHWPIIVFARYWMAQDPLGDRAWWLLCISLLAAIGSYHFIEQPFRQRLIGSARRSLFTAAALAMSLLIAVGFAGVHANGAPGRFDALTVQLDRGRSAKIPFRECDDRPNKNWKTFCVIGDPVAGPPMLLIWGDSHALAWGPGFDVVLKQQHMSAYFVPNSSCPPLLGVHNKFVPGCHDQNLVLQRFIDQQRHLKGVIMTSFWGRYFSDGNQAILSDDAGETGNVRVASAGLDRTLRYLKTRGLVPVLLEDVPGAQQDVPLTMALNRALGAPEVRRLTPADYRATNALFHREARKAALSGRVALINVAEWFCDADVCRYQEAGIPLYHDKTHLSVAGSVSRAPQLTSALAQAGLLGQSLSSAAMSAPIIRQSP